MIRKEFSNDEASPAARREMKFHKRTIVIVLGVIGITFLGYLWFTKPIYNQFSDFGFAVEYPEELNVTVETIDNIASSNITGAITFFSEDEQLILGWLSDIESPEVVAYLNSHVDWRSRYIEISDIEFLNISLHGHEFASAQYITSIKDELQHIKVGFGYCDVTQRVFYVFYSTSDEKIGQSYPHFLETLECH
jgi:hypothetical protein